MTVPAAALRPHAASGESDAGAPPSSHGYLASDSPLYPSDTVRKERATFDPRKRYRELLRRRRETHLTPQALV